LRAPLRFPNWVSVPSPGAVVIAALGCSGTGGQAKTPDGGAAGVPRPTRQRPINR